jgi:DNA-binding NtrC family response regulator
LYTVEDNVIQVYHLPQFFSRVIENYPIPEIRPLKMAVQELERKMITQALLTTGNNRAAAANYLGIPRATFYLKIKEYGLMD